MIGEGWLGTPSISSPIFFCSRTLISIPHPYQLQSSEGSGMVRDPERAVYIINIYIYIYIFILLWQSWEVRAGKLSGLKFCPFCCLPSQLQVHPPLSTESSRWHEVLHFSFLLLLSWLNVKTGYILTNCPRQGLQLGLCALLNPGQDTFVALRVYILMDIKTTVRDAWACRSPALLKKTCVLVNIFIYIYWL